eukprot:GFUD01002089.1.p1 GENE.GFUD01002089.1~~GFUD01002089.1.p1  ORF type:complete len:179 (+),score=75.44 GFUD01002089.1:165-701(+)
MESKSQATLFLFLSLTVSILQAQPIIIVLGGQTQAATAPLILMDIAEDGNDFQTLETIKQDEDDTVTPTDDYEIIVVDIDEDDNDSVWNKIKEESENSNEIFLVDIKEQAEIEEINDEIMSTDIQEISTTEINHEMENVNVVDDYEIVASDDPIDPAIFGIPDINEKDESLERTESVE